MSDYINYFGSWNSRAIRVVESNEEVFSQSKAKVLI